MNKNYKRQKSSVCITITDRHLGLLTTSAQSTDKWKGVNRSGTGCYLFWQVQKTNKQKKKQREDVCVCVRDGGGNRMLASRGLVVV